MKLYFRKIILFTALLATSSLCFSQIGIGTVTPEGALDIESSDLGFVFPRVGLASTAIATPVLNPNGGNLAEGTVVYNTTLSTLGANDVSPGIYVWDGTEWIAQHLREDYKLYKQIGGCQRTTTRNSYSDPNPSDADIVSGFFEKIFTPKYSGLYRIQVSVNYSAGEIDDFTSLDNISLATSEGAFFFSMSGPGVSINPPTSYYDYEEGWVYTHSYATFNSNESPDLEDNTVPHFATLVYEKYLLAGNNYSFELSNCIITGHNYFLNNGDSGEGMGHIGHEIPCTVEFTYIGI